MTDGNDSRRSEKKSLKTWLLAGITFATMGFAGAANAALILDVVDTKAVSGPFGLLFDGSNIWYSVGTGTTLFQIDQTAAGMPNTGLTVTTPSGGERAWDGSHFVTAGFSRTLFLTNPDGTSAGSITLADGASISGAGLIDGLDFDQGEIWYSPDIGAVYRLDGSGAFTGPVNPVLPVGGGFSGVERIDISMDSFLIVVNDAVSPRQLCQTTLTGSFDAVDDCVTIPNARFEGLAFDGRFLYAADFYGNQIVKLDLQRNGGSIFNPGDNEVPEPASLALFGFGLAGLGFVRRRKTK